MVKTEEEIAQEQEQYDNLIMERGAFLQANMTAKVEEWDYKIKHLEISQKYSPVTFNDMAESFGIEGLQKAVDLKKQQMAVESREMKAKAKTICGDFLKVKKIGESKLWDFIDKHSWQWANDPTMTQAVMEIILPKLHVGLQGILRATFSLKKIETYRSFEADKVAFIKIERIEDYQQNDNPPHEELAKLIQAQNDSLFEAIYIGYPMIDKVKELDPIFFGVIQDPTKSYSDVNGFGSDWLANDSVTLERLNTVNIGEMFKIAEWI